jgi:hypothetical protein
MRFLAALWVAQDDTIERKKSVAHWENLNSTEKNQG